MTLSEQEPLVFLLGVFGLFGEVDLQYPFSVPIGAVGARAI